MSAKAALEEAIAQLRAGGAGNLTKVTISSLMYDQLVRELGREDIQNVFGVAIDVDPALDELPQPGSTGAHGLH